ncbi:MAG: hypothetical protein RR565_06090 [Erysipelothrix sp.]
MIKKYLFSLSVYLLIFLGLAAFIINKVDSGFGVIIVSLIISNSLAVLIVSMFMSYRYGFDYVHTILMVLIYTISVYVIFNESALFYLPFYLLIDLVGFGIGRLIRNTSQS